VWISSAFTNSRLGSKYFERGAKRVVEGKNLKCILRSLEFSMIGTFWWILQLYDFSVIKYQQISKFYLS
jgi:hypothetical protein